MDIVVLHAVNVCFIFISANLGSVFNFNLVVFLVICLFVSSFTKKVEDEFLWENS